ncbi:endolytic transglycosylase MltG [Rothia sp. AR01]|uniref:Endolytic murein transglycosylase n=1 Tax=Rothia santali TaxID=2949643 RepID=A0A9X2HEJ0_9MICC|nr:endolytic transglycosylase MltG [Rothia santali]MCP3426840.1 endolytic transglycosylase MltG [Rothia santali]
MTVTVSGGEGNAAVAQKLESQGVVANAGRFLDVYDERAEGQFIQPGTFELEEEMSSESAVDALLGTGGAAQHYVAVDQGLRMDETFQRLAEATGIELSEFESFEDDPGAFGIPDEFPTLEGYLHPGEYRFPTDATAEDVLREMTQRTKDDLDSLGITDDEEIFHAVTVGSILEFEATPSDYAAVAGAIDNRIENPQGETQGFLQSDATVAYGLGEKTYQITSEQKADTSNRYNTFAIKGLPVGPIGSPDKTALEAAAEPDSNDYYFWVTVNLDTGETKFARTYQEHQQNVAEYDQWCSDNPGKCI